jgi:hypothetical protein
MMPSQHHVFSTKPTQKHSALCSRSLQVKFFHLFKPSVAEAKNLISQDGRKGRDAYQSQQGMMKNEARKNEQTKSKIPS